MGHQTSKISVPLRGGPLPDLRPSPTVAAGARVAAKDAAVNELLDRVVKLQHAVKFAREEANGIEVEDQKVGAAVFGYLFG